MLSFKNGNNVSTRDSFDKYYMPLVEIKDFIALIDNRQFFDQPVKKKQKKKTRSVWKKILKWQEMVTTQHEIY